MAALGIARAASDFITQIQLIREAPAGALPQPAQLRSSLLRLLDGVASGAGAVAPEELEEAKFALVAWADEAILASTWTGREDWARETLQMQLYRTSKAGDEFFDHLQRLRPEQNDAREVYLLALALGFEGQYAGQDAERRALTATQYEMLRASGRYLETEREQLLTPAAYQVEVDLKRSSSGGLLRALLLMALGVGAIYGILWAFLQYFGANVPPQGG